MAFGVDTDTISAKVWIILGFILLFLIAGVIFLAPKAIKILGWS